MDDIFCKIVRKEAPADIVFEDDDIIAFKPLKSSAPAHYLVVPKEHIESIKHLRSEHKEIVAKIIFTAKMLAERLGLDGYKLVFNVGRKGGQVIDHLHLHLLGGWTDKKEIDAMPHPGLDNKEKNL